VAVMAAGHDVLVAVAAVARAGVSLRWRMGEWRHVTALIQSLGRRAERPLGIRGRK
jgi:hypothetical protein